MTRRRLTAKQRLAIFEHHGGSCWLCKLKIDGVRERWDLDHQVPLALGGADEFANLAPVHERCHREKTSAKDVPAIAKAERVRAKHLGARKPGGFRRPSGFRYDWSQGRYVRV